MPKRPSLGVTRPIEGPPAHERTLEEFVGRPELVSEDLGFWNEEAFFLHGPRKDEYQVVRKDFYRTRPTLTLWGGTEKKVVFDSFSLAVVKKNPLHAILLHRYHDARTGLPLSDPGPVGEFYKDAFGNILGIAMAYRGKGVGPEFLAAAIEETGNVSPPAAYSPAGLRNRERAHRILVRNALLRGEKVPPEVLARYPELAGL